MVPPPGRDPDRLAAQRGLALIAVLWVVSLLSVMALDVLAAARREGETAQDLATRARLEAAADAGLALAIHALVRADADSARSRDAASRFKAGAPPIDESFEGVRLTIGIEDESGKIDVNRAPARLLAQFFEALREPRPRAEALAAAIEDWRDDDEEPSGRGGAEATEYRRARRAVMPRDAFFQSLDELRHVIGMSPELFERAAPSLTVHSHRPAPDPEVAGPLVLQVVGPGRSGAPQPARQRLREAATGPRLSPLAGRAFRIQIEASEADGLRRRSAVVRLTGNPHDPYWVQEYR
jgi:general secretion pathway protein K